MLHVWMASAKSKNWIEMAKILLKEKKKSLCYDFSHVFIC